MPSIYMKEGDALPIIQRHISQKRIEKYAVASGDFNPIHVNKDFAAKSQFGTTIAHGMMIAAFISEMMTAAFRERWLEGGRLKLRFRAPVLSGETICTFGRVTKVKDKDGMRELTCEVRVRKQGGEAAISGEAVVSVPHQLR